jgi:predicted RNase H-like nuclease (RuvC/YqgF family)
MDPVIVSALSGLLGVVAGALLSAAVQFFKIKKEAVEIGARADKIKTDMAGELIEYAKGLLAPYREEVETLRSINKDLKKENAEFKLINEELKRDNLEFKRINDLFILKINELQLALDKCNECLLKLETNQGDK